MSLYFTLRASPDESLGQVSIRRITHLDLPGSLAVGTENTYEVRLGGKRIGTVEHRYDEGGFVLASKALVLIAARTKNDTLIKESNAHH